MAANALDMLHQGPVPAFVHGVIEYAAGALLIVAPFVFAFEDSSATAASVVVGLVLLAFTATSKLPTGEPLNNQTWTRTYTYGILSK